MPKKYAREPAVPEKAVKTCGADIRASFKNTYNTARAIQGMKIKTAQKYLNQVLEHQRCIPFRRYNGALGRTAQAKEFGLTQGRWPTKSIKIVLNLLDNLEANSKVKHLDVEKIVVSHVQVNRAAKGRRRTYRAHGRVTPFLSSNCHIEMWASETAEAVTKEGPKTVAKFTRVNKKSVAATRHRKQVATGGDK